MPTGRSRLALPEGASGSAAVSVHAGQAADCRWLGYHAPGGLTTIRDAATPADCERRRSRRDPHRTPRTARRVVRRAEISARHGGGIRRHARPGTLPRGIRQLRRGSNLTAPSRCPWPRPGRIRRSCLSSTRSWAVACSATTAPTGSPHGARTRPASKSAPPSGPGSNSRSPPTVKTCATRRNVLTGTVQWPNGQPAEGTWLYADTLEVWAVAGPDGAFELRLPQGSPPSLLSVLAGEAAGSCWVGHHRPDGLTPHPDQASSSRKPAPPSTSPSPPEKTNSATHKDKLS